MGNHTNNTNNTNDTNDLRVMLEIGLRGKRVVAVALDWPGLERVAATGEAAIERLLSCVPRYAPVAKLAGMEAEFATSTTSLTSSSANVRTIRAPAQRTSGGISFGFSGNDQQALPGEELERELKLMRSCWTFFDDVRQRVSAEMQKGPRGGGRDRDRIVRHVLFTERDWAKMVGVITPEETILTGEELNAYRDAYCNAIRAFHSEGKMARKWPLRYPLFGTPPFTPSTTLGKCMTKI